MKIYIPNSAFLNNLEGLFLKNLDLTNPKILEITAHPKWFAIHPLTVAMIGALGRTFDPKNISCEQIVATSGHYLSVMELFKFIGIPDPFAKDIEKHELTGKVIPLTEIKTQADSAKFLQELVPTLHLDPKKTVTVRYIFSELIRNVLEHSKSPIGAVVCAQYYKSKNRISIGIADRGLGLKETIRNSYLVPDEEHAIKLALQPGITGTTKKIGGTTENAGMGLFVIKTIAVINGDYFYVISGDTRYKLLQAKKGRKQLALYADPFDDKHTKGKIPHWQGVAIGIDISLDDTKEFSEMLGNIYQFYQRSIKKKKQERYKKPKFI